MRVVRAQHAGACYGVQRALDLACAAADGAAPVVTFGPLIHNPQVVAELAERGAVAVGSIDDARGKVAVIRSHGALPAERRQLQAVAADVVDATCPHVARAQMAAAELAKRGCHVLVVGEAGHPEVESLVAYAQEAGAAVDVVAGADEVPRQLAGPVGVVVQTTQTREALDAVVAELASRGIDPVVKNTICSATRQRQKTASQLASEADAMVVIGGRNSSNTTRLAEICAERCPRTFHIESADELDAGALAGCAVVGVTAGASTPESQIAAVVAHLEALGA